MDGTTLDVTAATRAVVSRLIDGISLVDCTMALIVDRLGVDAKDGPPSVADALADFLVAHVGRRVAESNGDPGTAMLELSKQRWIGLDFIAMVKVLRNVYHCQLKIIVRKWNKPKTRMEGNNFRIL